MTREGVRVPSDLFPWVIAAYGTVVFGVLGYLTFVRSRSRLRRRRGPGTDVEPAIGRARPPETPSSD